MLATKFQLQFNKTIKLLQFKNYAEVKMRVQKNVWDGYGWQQQNVGTNRWIDNSKNSLFMD